MASSAPPPYTEQQPQPAYNPGYAVAPPNQGYPPANPGYPPTNDPTKFGPHPGYPAGQYPPPGQYPAPGQYPPPGQYPASGPYPPAGAAYPPGPGMMHPAPQQQQQQQTIVVTTAQATVATGNCPVCRVSNLRLSSLWSL